MSESAFDHVEEKRLTVLGFPDRVAFEKWFYSQEYQSEIRLLRRMKGGNWVTSYHGFDRFE